MVKANDMQWARDPPKEIRATIEAMSTSKGIRRLAVLLGAIGSMTWPTFVMVISRKLKRLGDGSSWS